MEFLNTHLLSLILFFPALAALVIFFLPNEEHKLIRWTAFLASLVPFGLSIYLWLNFKSDVAGYQFDVQYIWYAAINSSFHFGVDGLSLTMVLLTTILTPLALLASFGISDRVKAYMMLFLFLETGLLGVFMALDLLIFFLFWEVELVPMYFLINQWGGANRNYASLKFMIYTMGGSLGLLLGIQLLGVLFGTFDLVAVTEKWTSASGSLLGFPIESVKTVIFWAFVVAFAVKVPVWPFHTWLPDAHVEAPTPISVILAGVLLKMGTYGFFRFSYPLFPEATHWFQPAMAVLAIVGIIYGGFVALAQTDFKKMVAYSSVSHMGFVLLGLAALNADGFRGAMLQMFTHGTITGGLFLLVGVLYDRAHTRDLNGFGGLGVKMPAYAGFLTFFALASLGLPSLSGFVSEFLALLGSYQYSKPVTALSTIGIILAAAYLLYMVQRVLLGKLNPKWAQLPDINLREVLTLVPLMVLILGIGVYPRIILDYMIPTLDALLKTIKVS